MTEPVKPAAVEAIPRVTENYNYWFMSRECNAQCTKTHSKLCTGLGGGKAYGCRGGGKVETEAAILVPIREHLKSVVRDCRARWRELRDLGKS